MHIHTRIHFYTTIMYCDTYWKYQVNCLCECNPLRCILCCSVFCSAYIMQCAFLWVLLWVLHCVQHCAMHYFLAMGVEIRAGVHFAVRVAMCVAVCGTACIVVCEAVHATVCVVGLCNANCWVLHVHNTKYMALESSSRMARARASAAIMLWCLLPRICLM